jgi:signal transduction histidine kinase
VTNAVRHSGARTCTVSIKRDSGAVELQVIDDGRGRASAEADGYGLMSARERIAAVGGELCINDSSSGGFRVCATVPQGAAG